MSKVKELFVETKKVIEAYNKQAEALEAQEQELKGELETLQNEMIAIMMDLEGASVSDKVYLKIRQKEIVTKAEIIGTILEELAEEKTDLKLQFVLRQSIKHDSGNKAGLSAQQIVEKYRYLMLAEIAEIGNEMQKQYNAIAPDVMEVFEDEAVRKEFPRLEYAFNSDQYTPTFSWFSDSVVSKKDVFSSCRGYKPNKPNHMEAGTNE
jgi:hypothetical protein